MAKRLKIIQIFDVRVVPHHGSQINFMILGQVFDGVIGPDFVTLIGGVWNPVG